MAPHNRTRSTLAWLGLFVLLALTLRVAFNVADSFDDDTERYLYSGNDPYYHDRTVRSIMEEGEHLQHDPAINYPDGAFNPNPPLFDWSALPFVPVADAFGSADPVGLTLNVLVAVWGALTVIPVYVIARDLWGRGAGLWSAFFMAVSAPHIQRSVFGFADHDATTMFWVAMTFMFLVKALQSLARREYVSDWRRSDARMAGIRDAWLQNQRAFAWAIMAGLSLAAVALTWKGYPYVLAIMAFALGFQLLQDHLKNRDSTAILGIYLVPLLLVIVLPYLLYYRIADVFVATTIVPSIYVLLGALVAGLVLVPTRDMPSIVVFPALFVAAILGLLFLWFVVPSVGQSIFTGLGYFDTSKLYTTVAEAQRTPLGRVAASFGFFSFLLAFWAFFLSLRRALKGQVGHMLLAFWAIVAIFMAFAAARFVSNAAPLFAILMGAATARLVAMSGFDAVRQRYRRAHGRGAAGAVGSLTWRSTLAGIAVALFLVLPNVWIGVDAGTNFEFDARHDLYTNDPRGDLMGAFGVYFDVDNNGWLALFNHLAQLDSNLSMAERPAFMAWWDYGHWATVLGDHPTVADPFQNHYNMAGRFLASESEQEAVAWLTFLLVNDARRDPARWDAARETLVAHDPQLVDVTAERNLNVRMERYLNVTSQLGDETVFDVYEDIMDATDRQILYFGVDARMWPQSARDPGIFYAPVFLSDKDPDDFIATVYPTASGPLTQQLYAMRDGTSYQLPEPLYVDQSGKEYVVAGGRAYERGKVPPGAEQGAGTGGIQLQAPQLQPQARFFQTMYAQAFGHIDVAQAAPGEGLTHWRAIFEDTFQGAGGRQGRNTVLLEYYRGVEVEGRVTDSQGQPVAGATVTFSDGFGATHARGTTQSDGTYSVRAPFGDDLALRVLMDGAVVATRDDASLQFTREQARNQDAVDGVDIVIERGELQGIIFEDADPEDGGYNATVDTPVEGAMVSIGADNRTTDAQGRYVFQDILPGQKTLTVTKNGYQTATRAANVPAGGSGWANQSLALANVPVQFHVIDEDHEPVPAAPIQVAGQTVRTDGFGNATAQVRPGTHNATVEYTTQVDGEEVILTGRAMVQVTPGAQGVQVTIALQRQT